MGPETKNAECTGAETECARQTSSPGGEAERAGTTRACSSALDTESDTHHHPNPLPPARQAETTVFLGDRRCLAHLHCKAGSGQDNGGR